MISYDLEIEHMRSELLSIMPVVQEDSTANVSEVLALHMTMAPQ